MESGAAPDMETLQMRDSDRTILFGLPGALAKINEGSFPPPQQKKTRMEEFREEGGGQRREAAKLPGTRDDVLCRAPAGAPPGTPRNIIYNDRTPTRHELFSTSSMLSVAVTLLDYRCSSRVASTLG